MLDQPAHAASPDGAAVPRRRHLLYVVTTVVLTVIVGLALLEGVGKVPVYGVTTRTAEATAPDGTRLRVRYGRVVRGALASALEVTVTKQGGFADDVSVAITRTYFELFRTTGVTPQPAAAASAADADVYTFSEPAGDELAASWQNDGSPLAWFDRRMATVAVLGLDGRPIVAVTITSELRP